MIENKTTIQVTVRDSAARKVPIKRVTGGSKGEHKFLLDTTGLTGPLTVTATLSGVS